MGYLKLSAPVQYSSSLEYMSPVIDTRNYLDYILDCDWAFDVLMALPGGVPGYAEIFGPPGKMLPAALPCVVAVQNLSEGDTLLCRYYPMNTAPFSYNYQNIPPGGFLVLPVGREGVAITIGAKFNSETGYARFLAGGTQ